MCAMRWIRYSRKDQMTPVTETEGQEMAVPDRGHSSDTRIIAIEGKFQILSLSFFL